MKLKRILSLLIVMAMVLSSMGTVAFAADNNLYVSTDYNSATEGYGVTRFSNYASAYAYATANNKKATIVIEKNNTLSGFTFDNNHKNYSSLAVVIKDGATMGVALSKWDMTYPVTVEAGGTLTCARPKNSSVSNIHIKNKLIIGTKDSEKQAYCYFLSDSYQDCDISIRYNGSITLYNAVMTVQDLDAQGTFTATDSDISVDGAFASATFFGTTLTDSNMQINGNLISGGLSDFAGGTTNQLGKVTLNGDSSIEFEAGSTVKVASTVTVNGNSSISADALTVNKGQKINVNGTSSVTANTLTNNGTIAAVSSATVTAETVSDDSTGTLTIDGKKAEFDESGSLVIPPWTIEGAEVNVVDKGNNTYDITLKDGATWTDGVTKAEITLPAVDGAEDAYVVHEHNGVNHIYVGKVADGKITFTNNVGFSTFTVYAGGLNDALTTSQKGDTIILLEDITGNVNINKSIVFDGNNKNVTGKLNVTADGAIVKNLNVNNGSSNGGYISAKDVQIENCNVTGGNGFRNCYTSGTVTFRDSTITGSTYGIHFDGSAGGSIVIDNCNITGWTSFASTIEHVTMTNTTFNEGNYNYIRFYQDATIEGCTFNEKMGVDVANSVDATVKVTNSTVTNGTVEDLFDSEDVDRCEVYVDNTLLVNPVAKIGDTEYKTLEEAFTKAQDGETITLLSNATPTLTSQRAITKASVIDLGGNTLTLTEDDLYFGTTTFKNGTIVVDESVKPSTAVFWMFANQTLTFDNVKLIASGVTGTYLIGLDGNNSDFKLINESEIVVENETALDLDIICVNASTGNDILVENSKVTVKNLDGRVFFRGNYTVSGNSEVNLDGITKAGFRIEAGQTLTISDTANVTITGEPRDGGIHLTDATAVYTVADTATVTATVNKPAPPVAKIGDTTYTTLEDALNAASSMTGNVTVEILDKVTLNKSLSGSYDSITFVGTTDTAEIYLDVQGYITATGKNVAFTDLTLSKSEGGYITNAGFMNVAFGIYDVLKVTYTNCTFTNGAYASSGVNTFTECTFYRSYDKYGLWAYGDAEVIVDKCVFADYRGIKMYAEDKAKTTELTVTNTDFSKVTDKPAIVLTYGESVELEGNTYSSTGTFELDLDGDPNGTPVTSDVSPVCVNDNGACGVLVDGKIYTTVAQAKEVATEGSTVTLLHNSAETVELAEGVTLNKNGFEAAGITVKVSAPYGTLTNCYTSGTGYWGECGGNAKESFEFKFYNDDTYMGYTSLNNVGGIIDGDVYVSWSIKLDAESNTDEYWDMAWSIQPTVSMQPNKVEQWVDGVKVAEAVVEPNWSDSIFPVVALVADDDGKILSFVNNTTGFTLNDAFANGGNIVILKDIILSEPLTVGKDTKVTLDLAGFDITYNSTTQNEAMITNKGNLTINDSVGDGVINYNYTGAADSSYSKGNYTISNLGTLNLNGGKITIANLRAHAKYPVNNNSTSSDAVFIMNGGHLYNYNTAAIRQFCNSTTYKNSVTINGGLVEGYSAIWVQNPGASTVNASLNITGGEVRTTAAAYVNGTSEIKDVSSKIYCSVDGEGGAWSEDSLVSITGGTINENVYFAEQAPESITVNEEVCNGYVELPAVYVAKIGDTSYATLEEAFKAATEGCTIEILSDVTVDYKWDCRDYATNGSHSQFKESVTINGNNHTIKFTGTVNDNNWNTIFRFEENAKVKDLIIDISEATGIQRVITAKKSLDVDNLTIIGSAKYGIIFGEGASAEDLAAAEISVSNSDLYGTRRAISDNEGGKDVKSVTITDNILNANVYVSASDTVTFTGNTMTAGYVDIRSYTENNTLNVTATGNTLTANTDTIYNEINAGGTVNAQDDFVLPAASVAKIGETEYTSLADAAVAAVSGDTITMIADAAEDVTLPAGIIFDGNDKQVGAITAAGEITFKGYTKATNFSVQYTNTTINIGEGACLELTGTGRMVIGHGSTFNITGSITDAKNADTANITPSLIAAGASLTGAGVNFNVTNAYIKFTAYCSSKNSNASGTYNINVTNSIWEQTGSLVFSEPTNSKDPTFNFNVKDSVLNSTSHLVFAVTKGEIVFDNSNVNVGTSRQIENRSTLTIKNGSVVNGAVATSSNAKNPGTLIIENATYSVTGEFTGSDVGTGTIVIMDGANFTAGKITNANIQIDATNMSAGDEIKLTADLSGLTGTVEVINNDKLVANIVDNKIVLSAKAEPIAKVGDTEYTSLQAAINNANGATVTLIANTAETISIDNDATVVIDLGGNILTGYIAPCDPVSLTVKNGSIVNTNGNYSAIEINSGKLTLENTNIESARHGVRIDGAVEAIINGGEYKLNATSGTRHAVNVSGGATLTIKDGTFIGPKGTTMDSGSAVCVQSGATVIIEDGNFSGGKNATLGVSGIMTIYGGTFDQNPSEYLADGYIARGANGEITTDEYIVCEEDFDIKVLMLWDFDKVQAPDADGTMVDCYPVALFGIINTLNYKEVGFILEFEDPDTKEIKTHNFVTNDAYTSLLVNEDVKNQIGASSTTVTPDMYDGTYFYGDMMNMKAKYADSPLRFRPYAKLLDGTYVYGKARYNIDEITDKDDK